MCITGDGGSTCETVGTAPINALGEFSISLSDPADAVLRDGVVVDASCSSTVTFTPPARGDPVSLTVKENSAVVGRLLWASGEPGVTYGVGYRDGFHNFSTVASQVTGDLTCSSATFHYNLPLPAGWAPGYNQVTAYTAQPFFAAVDVLGGDPGNLRYWFLP